MTDRDRLLAALAQATAPLPVHPYIVHHAEGLLARFGLTGALEALGIAAHDPQAKEPDHVTDPA